MLESNLFLNQLIMKAILIVIIVWLVIYGINWLQERWNHKMCDTLQGTKAYYEVCK